MYIACFSKSIIVRDMESYAFRPSFMRHVNLWSQQSKLSRCMKARSCLEVCLFNCLLATIQGQQGLTSTNPGPRKNIYDRKKYVVPFDEMLARSQKTFGREEFPFQAFAVLITTCFFCFSVENIRESSQKPSRGSSKVPARARW